MGIQQQFKVHTNIEGQDPALFDQQKIKAYEWYLNQVNNKKCIQSAFMSFSLTTVFLISRVPRQQMHRSVRLGGYLSLAYLNYGLNKSLNTKLEKEVFSNVSLKLLPESQVKQMLRTY